MGHSGRSKGKLIRKLVPKWQMKVEIAWLVVIDFNDVGGGEVMGLGGGDLFINQKFKIRVT